MLFLGQYPSQWLSREQVPDLDDSLQHGTPLMSNLCSEIPHWVGKMTQICIMVWGSPCPILLSLLASQVSLKTLAILILSQYWLPKFEQAPGVGDGQGSLRAAVHGVTKSWTRLSDWTDWGCTWRNHHGPRKVCGTDTILARKKISWWYILTQKEERERAYSFLSHRAGERREVETRKDPHTSVLPASSLGSTLLWGKNYENIQKWMEGLKKS